MSIGDSAARHETAAHFHADPRTEEGAGALAWSSPPHQPPHFCRGTSAFLPRFISIPAEPVPFLLLSRISQMAPRRLA